MTTVDKRVVEMEFKNQQFESNVKKTQSTLDKLKQALAFKGATDGFGQISKAANGVDLSALAKSVDAIKNRFSTLGIVGMTIINNLTTSAMNAVNKIFSQMSSGGITRAMNIEHAKFMFEGLGMDVEASMASANAAVKGTAYGLDSAAKAASQLGASGMRAGDEMTSSLRAIAGVAAMTSSEYDDIANIFTTVAGNGRLMGDQLLQLSGRGINAAATLAQELGKSEQEIRDMVSEGEISFETFYKAMDNAFGAHAKDANKTFTGALANMKAALNRIGADVASPALDHLRDVFNALTPVIDNVHKALMPFIGVLETAMQKTSSFVRNFLDKLNFDGLTKSVSTFSIIADAGFTGLFNIIKALGSVLSPIKDAFFAVFPPIEMTREQAVKLANDIRNLTFNLQLNEEQAGKIKAVFEKVFSIFKSVFSIVGKAVSVVFQLASAIASFVVGLKPLQGGLFAVVDGLSAFISNVANAVASANIIDSLVQLISNGLNRIKESINNFFSGTNDDGFASGIVETFHSITAAIGDFFNNGFDLEKLASTFKTIFGTGVFAIVGTAISKVSINLSSLSNIVKRLFDNLASGQNINVTVFSQLKSSLFTLQQNLNAATLLQIAISIGVLAIALDKLAKINLQDLVKALAATTVGLKIMMMSLETMTKILDGKSTKGLVKTSISLILVATAVSILAAAVKIFSKLSLNELAKGLAAVGVVLLELAAFTHLVKPTQLAIASSGLIALAEAMVILSVAVAIFGNMDMNSLLKGLGAVGLLLMEIAAFTNVSANSVKVLASAAALAVMSAAILGLSVSFKVFASMSLSEIGKGLIAIGSALFILSTAMRSMGNAKVLAGSLAISSAAVSLMLIAPALKLLGSMSLEQIAVALGALAGTFAVFGIAGALLGGVVPTLLALSVAIGIFGAAVLMAGVGVAAFGAGLTMIAAAITSLGAGSTVALTALASLIPMFVEQIALSIQKILELITNSFTQIIESVVTIITAVCQAIITALPQIVEAVTALIQAFCQVVIDNIPMIVETAFVVIMTFLQGIRDHIYEITTLVGEIVTGFINGLSEQLPSIIQAGFNFILSFINGLADSIRTNMPLVLEAVWNLATSIIDGIVNTFTGGEGNVVDSFLNIIGNVLSGLGEKIPEFLTKGMEFIRNIIQGIGRVAGTLLSTIGSLILNALSKIGSFLGDFLSKGIELITNIISGIGEKAGEFLSSIGDLIMDGVNHIGDFVSDIAQAGKDLIDGLIGGIKEMAQNAIDAVGGVVNDAINAAKNLLGIQSPSKVFAAFGRFIDLGLAQGVDKNANTPVGSVEKLGSKVISTMSKAMTAVEDLAEDTDFTPTITPVLDASQFDKDVSKLHLDRQLSIGVTNTKAHKAIGASSRRSSVLGNSNTSEQGETVINNNFTQNNYSPKSLSRIDIYRQSKNLFARTIESSLA